MLHAKKTATRSGHLCLWLVCLYLLLHPTPSGGGGGGGGGTADLNGRIEGVFWVSNFLQNRQFLRIFVKPLAIFRQNRHFSWGPVGHVIRIFVKLLAIFRQIAIFAMFLIFRQNGHSSSGPLGNIIRILIKPLAKFR